MVLTAKSLKINCFVFALVSVLCLISCPLFGGTPYFKYLVVSLSLSILKIITNICLIMRFPSNTVFGFDFIVNLTIMD